MSGAFGDQQSQLRRANQRGTITRFDRWVSAARQGLEGVLFVVSTIIAYINGSYSLTLSSYHFRFFFPSYYLHILLGYLLDSMRHLHTLRMDLWQYCTISKTANNLSTTSQ